MFGASYVLVTLLDLFKLLALTGWISPLGLILIVQTPVLSSLHLILTVQTPGAS